MKKIFIVVLGLVAVGCGGDLDLNNLPEDVEDSGHNTIDDFDGGFDADVEEPDQAVVPDLPDEPALVPGLTATYFRQYREPILTVVEPAIDHEWGDEAPADGVGKDFFSARWTGLLKVPADGEYTFWASTDDGMRVWVDDELVIDAWTWQFPTRYENTIALQQGQVPFRVDYMERDLTAEAKVGWSVGNGAERVLNENDFLTTGVAANLAPPKSPYLNPVVARDCPDPGVAYDEETRAFYAICTGGKFHVRRSYDLVFWEDTGADVLPSGKPAWAANGGRNWAPEIHKVGDKWVVYYTSVNGNNNLCIGAASADSPTGPYVDRGSPLVEHSQGVIDANYFKDDNGKHYLSYKIDGNAHGQPTPIYIRELAADGLSFKSGSTQREILRNNAGTWEGGVVEAQWMVKRGDTYYLFYSGNVYNYRYRTGVARASSPTGPFTKLGPPILTNNSKWVGPGHGSVVTVGDTDYFVYHAWHNDGSGTNDGSQGRNILVDKITWSDGWPKIANGSPSTTRQPAPL